MHFPDFKNIPFLRILVPFLAGILVCSSHEFNHNLFYLLGFTFMALVILHVRGRKQNSVLEKRVYIIVSDVFLFLVGCQVCYLYNVKNDVSYFGHYSTNEKQVWRGKIKELPVEKEKFYKAVVNVTFLNGKQVTGDAMIYFKKPFDRALLQPGNFLKFTGAFDPIARPLNPHEFDHAAFCARKNIYFQGFVERSNVEFIKASDDLSIIRWAQTIKLGMIKALSESGLSKEAARLCAALLTGYDDEIDTETINAFAHSGTVHVLSVSGLHTGLLYAVLIFLLGFIDRKRKHKWAQLVIITGVLWLFVLITGFSPPVLRAAIMLNLIALGRYYYDYTKEHTINIVAVSAFLILVFNPLLIYDTGFLLSYSAVLGILYFEPYFTALINSRYRLLNKIWQLTSVSLSAQITTLPITLVLFHQFPLWFVFSNLVVIPLCIAIMFLGGLILLKCGFVAPLINGLTSILFYTIHVTDKPGWGYVDKIDFSFTDMAFLMAAIIGLALFMKYRSYSYISLTLALLIVWQINSLIDTGVKKSNSYLGIYHINKGTAIDVKNRNVLLFSSHMSGNNYNYHVKYNHAAQNYPVCFEYNFDYIRSATTSFLRISDSLRQSLIPVLKPRYILVTNNAALTGVYLKTPEIKLVLADGSNNYAAIQKLRLLCDKFAVPFYSTRQKGYWQVNL